VIARHFYLDPEVAGGLGRHSVMDVSVHPPIVTKLNYKFEGWLGDVILESFPCFIVTVDAQRALSAMGIVGGTFDDVEVTTSDVFEELQPPQKLPHFVWLKVMGHAGHDDFGMSKDYRLVVSERVLEALKPLGISNALLEPLQTS
jgi:hypothetical protein